MRRSRRGGKGSAFSLFPFLAVLLCTMGALVVLLVAMAHVARQKAQREAEAIATAPIDPAIEQRGAEAVAYRDRLGEVRSDAEERLRDEQARLSGIEDHIRRLRSEIESLVAEADELFALEQEHYDDREAAEEELARQRELIEDLEAEIAELEEEAAERRRRYAVVPLRDRETGTRRPAVYFECREDGVVLQPEGLVLGPEDFRPPVELSSPLSAAVRAINQYYADHPEARAANEAGAPYALLLVRPGGVEAYQRARAVLEAIDIDYGYQPIADDWPLEYETAKPDLSERVTQAIELARFERSKLALAAPQLFQPDLRAGWEWDGEPAAGGDDFGVGPVGGGAPDGFEGLAGERYAARPESRGAGPGPGGASTSGPSAIALQGESPQPQTAAMAAELTAEPASDGEAADGQTKPNDASNGATAAASAASVGEGSAAGSAVAAASSAPGAPSQQAGQGSRQPEDRPKRDGIAMRRRISMTVYEDRVVLWPGADAGVGQGTTIALDGPTAGNGRRLADALRAHAKSWGIAGNGFYWKPALELDVAAGGERRAAELADAFGRAGLDVRTSQSTAARGGGDDAPRR